MSNNLKELLKGKSEEHQITLPVQLETIGKKVKVEENCEHPWDVLDIISKTLDFDDLFQFSGVCKNWRTFHKIYWRNFLASQELLLVQFSNKEESFSFISISDQKVYCLKQKNYFHYKYHVTCFCGYFIRYKFNGSYMITNPFTRIKKVINAPLAKVSHWLFTKAFLAFGKCSEEFVLVVFCNYYLNVYQSRNCGWVNYPTMENTGNVVDVVVLNNIIYVLTDNANIGVLSLNSANIKFLKLKNTFKVRYSSYTNLVNCDEQLLVIDFENMEIKNVYKVDFSTMSYVKLETLGDIALFYSWNDLKSRCYALSNPSRWGYESNSIYAMYCSSVCSVYSGDDKKMQKCIRLPTSPGARIFTLEWCFRHLKYEVDYSLVE